MAAAAGPWRPWSAATCMYGRSDRDLHAWPRPHPCLQLCSLPRPLAFAGLIQQVDEAVTLTWKQVRVRDIRQSVQTTGLGIVVHARRSGCNLLLTNTHHAPCPDLQRLIGFGVSGTASRL